MSTPPGLTAYKLSFELSPIIFSGGIASAIGGILPIIALTESLNFINGILSGGGDLDPNDFFANFQPLPGSTLIEQQFGKYPFANQAVAANAVIAQPLTISMLMTCPARGPGGYALKTATMTALQAALAAHNSSGGTYTVATPSFIYTNCLLARLVDVSTGDSIQRQSKYQWDFEHPLLTLQSIQQAQSSLMQQLTSQVPNSNPTWSSTATIIGSGSSQPFNIAPVTPVSIGPAGASVNNSLDASPTGLY